jgi:hypothetical protein
MQRYTVYLYVETALRVSGRNTTRHQERRQLYLQRLVFVTPLQPPAAIMEKLELVWVCCTLLLPAAIVEELELVWVCCTLQLPAAIVEESELVWVCCTLLLPAAIVEESELVWVCYTGRASGRERVWS